MSLLKSDDFLADVERQFEWYAVNAGWDIAERYLTAVEATCLLLARHPLLGPHGGFTHPRLRDWRFIVARRPFQKHVLFYETTGDTVCVAPCTVIATCRDGSWNRRGLKRSGASADRRQSSPFRRRRSHSADLFFGKHVGDISKEFWQPRGCCSEDLRWKETEAGQGAGNIQHSTPNVQGTETSEHCRPFDVER